MNVRILLFFFLLTLLITENVNAGKFGSLRISLPRGSLSRGSYSSSSGRRSSSSYNHVGRRSWGGDSTDSKNYGYGTSSNGHATGSNLIGHGSSSDGHITGSSPFEHESSSGRHATGSSPFRHGSSLGGRTIGLIPAGHGTLSSQTPHQQNEDSSKSLIHAEVRNDTRPRIYRGNQVGTAGSMSKQNSTSAPYDPFAPYN